MRKYSTLFSFSALSNGSDESSAIMWLLNIGLMAKHHVVNNAGPPIFFQVSFALVAGFFAADVFLLKSAKGGKKKSK